MKNREHKPNESFGRTKVSEDSKNNKVNTEASNPIEPKTKFAVTGDSLRNGIYQKGLLKSHNVNVSNFPGGTSQ